MRVLFPFENSKVRINHSFHFFNRIRNMDILKEVGFQRNENTIFSLRFPQKLWKIINENDNSAIQWNKTGTTILVNYEKLKEEYLSRAQNTFKTTNISSFIRQLNLYGFRKVSGSLRQLRGDDMSKYRRHDQKYHEFYNEYFVKGRPDLMAKLTRKTIADKTAKPRKKNSLAKTCQKMQRSRIITCEQGLVSALENASRDQEVDGDESNSRPAQGIEENEREEVTFMEVWNDEVWLTANDYPATTAEALLKNINRGILSSSSLTDAIRDNNNNAHAWTGNTPPTEFVCKLKSASDNDVSCESSIVKFAEEMEIWNDPRPTVWHIIDKQYSTENPISDVVVMENMENKENVTPCVIAQPVEIAYFPYEANFQSNGETCGLSWSF